MLLPRKSLANLFLDSKINISLSANKSCLPRTLFVLTCELQVELCMVLTADLQAPRGTIRFTLVCVVEAILLLTHIQEHKLVV
jgi:hypothetical protein